MAAQPSTRPFSLYRMGAEDYQRTVRLAFQPVIVITFWDDRRHPFMGGTTSSGSVVVTVNVGSSVLRYSFSLLRQSCKKILLLCHSSRITRRNGAGYACPTYLSDSCRRQHRARLRGSEGIEGQGTHRFLRVCRDSSELFQRRGCVRPLGSGFGISLGDLRRDVKAMCHAD